MTNPKPTTPAQAAQQNNRDNGGKYATKVAGESGAAIDTGNELLTLSEWEEKAYESLTDEDKDKIARFMVGHAVYLASKQEWDLDDNFAVSEGGVELVGQLTDLPPEGEKCYECGMHVPDDFDDCPNTAEHEDE